MFCKNFAIFESYSPLSLPQVVTDVGRAGGADAADHAERGGARGVDVADS